LNRNPHKRARTQAGVSLIEILVAILVLSIGLLGMAGLQARALKGNNSALQRTQAVMLSYYVLDAMRLDKANATAGNYNMAKTCTVPTDTSTFMATAKKEWLQSLKTNLGNVAETCGAISCQASGVCTVDVYWDDSRAGGSSTQTVQTVSRL
jgi:type IV pilus assembly protein PilV